MWIKDVWIERFKDGWMWRKEVCMENALKEG